MAIATANALPKTSAAESAHRDVQRLVEHLRALDSRIDSLASRLGVPGQEAATDGPSAVPSGIVAAIADTTQDALRLVANIQESIQRIETQV